MLDLKSNINTNNSNSKSTQKAISDSDYFKKVVKMIK